MAEVSEHRPITVPRLLTARQVAQVLGLGERTVWRMTSRSRAGCGPFPRPVRVGPKAVRWRWPDIEKYLQKQAGN